MMDDTLNKKEIDDWSEVMAGFQYRVNRLVNDLNSGKWAKVVVDSSKMSYDLLLVCMWAAKKMKEEKKDVKSGGNTISVPDFFSRISNQLHARPKDGR